MKMLKTCILLTSCIKPSDKVFGSRLKNSKERYSQYISAIKYYLEDSKAQMIVLCDNSNTKPEDEIYNDCARIGKEFEWISFQGNMEETEKRGKGYGEGEIIDYAMRHSRLIAKSDSIVKITGRLIVKNINSILNVATSGCNYIDIYELNNGAYYADTRFFIYNKSDYDDLLLGCKDKVDERKGVIYETCIAESINDSIIKHRFIPFFPRFIGRAGGSGFLYSTSTSIRFQELLMRFIRTVTGRGERLGHYEFKMLERTSLWPEEMWDQFFGEFNGKKIVVYGTGIRGERFITLSKHRCRVVAWVDSARHTRIVNCRRAMNYKRIKNGRYDYVLVTVKKETDYLQIIKQLNSIGVDNKKILWLFDLIKDSNLYY